VLVSDRVKREENSGKEGIDNAYLFRMDVALLLHELCVWREGGKAVWREKGVILLCLI